jgi:hypothetical protein
MGQEQMKQMEQAGTDRNRLEQTGTDMNRPDQIYD